MIGIIDLVSFAAAVVGLAAALLGLFFTRLFPQVWKGKDDFFAVFFSVLLLYMASDLVSQISLVLLPEQRLSALSRVSVFTELLFSSALKPLLLAYLLQTAGEDFRKSPALAVAGGLCLMYFALLVLSQFGTEIYYISEDNVYRRGPWYPALLAVPALLLALNLTCLFRRWRAFTVRQRVAMTVYFGVPFVCIVIQMCFPALRMIVIGASFAALFLLVFLLWDQVEQYLAQEEENARQRASISALQMRPHFIYNTMTSIYYLIESDAKKAQQLTLDFVTYLRKSFTAVAAENMIPFAEELEHTRAYLAVEEARFSGKLCVSIDTPYTQFSLPPLTLQPLVENAVKHGMDPESAPLFIFVSTCKQPDGCKVIVQDSGTGFRADPNGGVHTALANIRERLAMACGGRLTVAGREGGGTTVEVFIPDCPE